MKPSTKDFPLPIITPRLLLRPPALNDAEVVNAAILESFEALHAFMPWAKTKPLLEETEAFVKQSMMNWSFTDVSEPSLPLFVFDIITGDFVGASGYHHINWDDKSLEIGYWIRNKYLGQGLMTEAVNALTHYAFSQLGIKRIEIRCDKNNIRSKKIPERLGYRLDAEGSLSDTLVYVKHSA